MTQKLQIQHGHLIRELVTQDIRSRYLGSAIGLFWSILNPLFQLLLYTTVFSIVLKHRLGPAEIPFAAYLFCGLLPWLSIQESLSRSATTYVENQNLIRKVPFPFNALPLTIVLSTAFHQLVGTIVFLVALSLTGNFASGHLVWFAPLVALELLMLYGLSLFIAALYVFLKDVAQILGVVLMLVFWTTPIVYSRQYVDPPAIYALILNLNPLTHMVEAFRFALLGSPPPSLAGVAYWAALSVAFFLLGKAFHKRVGGLLMDLV